MNTGVIVSDERKFTGRVNSDKIVRLAGGNVTKINGNAFLLFL